MPDKLWSGRFAEKTEGLVEAFTSSVDVDRRLYAYDIRGSVAHCKTLEKAGIISGDEASELVRGLEEVEREIEAGGFEFRQELEDIHMHIENRLTEKLGTVARKLHTARSRNDQVATDVRLYLRDEVRDVVSLILSLRKCLVREARKHVDVIMPGFTHLQRAQPVLLAHHLMAYYEMFSRDAERFRDSLPRINVMPLGSAALAGTAYPLDRRYTAELLRFEDISRNSMDAVSDRDFIVEFLAAASICMMHLSRLSEEIVLWSTAEFGYVSLPDAFSTGSSIMPQKKNPDVAELVRGKTSRVYGSLVSLLALTKSLPLAYNRDLQEDKEPLFDAVDTVKMCIRVMTEMLPHLTFHPEIMLASATTGFLNATDMADYLVSKGVPFREAHHCVGGAVQYALEQGKELHLLSLEELQRFSDRIDDDIYSTLEIGTVVNRRLCVGGTARSSVEAALEEAEERMEQEPGRKEGEPSDPR
ncbi:argininosuccinate lyase [Thermodesulfobacteriota bacterium]